jgi:hypothetical protein
MVGVWLSAAEPAKGTPPPAEVTAPFSSLAAGSWNQ